MPVSEQYLTDMAQNLSAFLNLEAPEGVHDAAAGAAPHMLNKKRRRRGTKSGVVSKNNLSLRLRERWQHLLSSHNRET